MILPWIALALLYAAFYTRLTRNQMLETLGEDYIRTARAKGLSERVVIGKHALPRRADPDRHGGRPRPRRPARWRDHHRVRSSRLPGLGRLSVDAVINVRPAGHHRRPCWWPPSFVIVANLIVDLLYAVIDPRVRLA